MNGKVFQEVSITLLNASISNPRFSLDLFSWPKFIKASLPLISAWVMNFNHSWRISLSFKWLSSALLVGIEVINNHWLLKISCFILEINNNFVGLNLLSILFDHPWGIHENFIHLDASFVEPMDLYSLVAGEHWMENCKLNLECLPHVIDHHWACALWFPCHI
jgi:hypothetical protein